MLQRAWQGRIEDVPLEYRNQKVPEGFSHVIIYSNGSRTYHHGLNPNQDKLMEVSRVMSRCWDSLTQEVKQEVNNSTNK